MTQKTTKCIECGKNVKYKTNKPKRCSACKSKKDKRSTSKKRNNRTKKNPDWSKEYFMFRLLDEIFPGESYIRNGYYSFLVSPKGEPMQLDIYYPERKLAFEYV